MKKLLMLVCCACAVGCSSEDSDTNPSTQADAGRDGNADALPDTNQSDGAMEGGTDATADVTPDAEVDAVADTAPEATVDAPEDTNTEPDTAADTAVDGPDPCVNDDGYEPNDEYSAAADLSSEVPGVVANLIGCDESDWYAFTVPANSGLVVTAAFTHAEANLNLYLYRASEPTSGIRYSSSLDDLERIQYDIFDVDTPLLLEVRNADADDGASTSYDLDISFHAEGICDDDALEPNDTPATASPMSTYPQGVLCGDNLDYYDLVVARSGPGTQIELVRGDVQLDAAVYPDNGSTAISTIEQNDYDNRTILTFDSEANTHYDLMLSNPSQQLTVPYSIKIVEPTPANDTCANAIPLVSGQQVTGWTYKANDTYAFVNASVTCVDYAMHGPDVAYSLTVPTDECLTVVASSSSDVSLYLLEDCATRCCWGGVDDEGQGVGTQELEETLEYCNATGSDQPLYLIVDSGLVNEQADFTLTVNIAPDPTARSESDSLLSGQPDPAARYLQSCSKAPMDQGTVLG